MKDAYYFSHDSNAKDDPKCVLLIEQMALEGYGIYWILVETLRDQPEYRYPMKLIPALARRYNTTAEKMRAVILSYDLFYVDNDEFFFSESLCKRMEQLDHKRNIQRGNALKRWENNAMALPRQCETMPVHESKVHESKVHDNKHDSSEPSQVSEPVIELPLIPRDGSFKITQEMIDEWVQTFPAVDVLQDLRLMKAWSDANPARRKTKAGAQKFIVSWLSRTQNRGGNKAAGVNGPVQVKAEFVTNNQRWPEIISMFEQGIMDTQRIRNLQEMRYIDEREAGYLHRKLRGDV